MKTSLDFMKDFLCVLAQYEVLHGQTQTSVKEWYPVRPAEEAEVATLVGRPLTEVEPNEGIYVDEEGNVFELAEEGATKAIEMERSFEERKDVGDGQTVVPPDEKEAPEEIKASARGKSKRVRL
jgi:hypothetical protein